MNGIIDQGYARKIGQEELTIKEGRVRMVHTSSLCVSPAETKQDQSCFLLFGPISWRIVERPSVART